MIREAILPKRASLNGATAPEPPLGVSLRYLEVPNRPSSRLRYREVQSELDPSLGVAASTLPQFAACEAATLAAVERVLLIKVMALNFPACIVSKNLLTNDNAVYSTEFA